MGPVGACVGARVKSDYDTSSRSRGFDLELLQEAHIDWALLLAEHAALGAEPACGGDPQGATAFVRLKVG